MQDLFEMLNLLEIIKINILPEQSVAIRKNSNELIFALSRLSLKCFSYSK